MCCLDSFHLIFMTYSNVRKAHFKFLMATGAGTGVEQHSRGLFLWAGTDHIRLHHSVTGELQYDSF